MASVSGRWHPWTLRPCVATRNMSSLKADGRGSCGTSAGAAAGGVSHRFLTDCPDDAGLWRR